MKLRKGKFIFHTSPFSASHLEIKNFFTYLFNTKIHKEHLLITVTINKQ